MNKDLARDKIRGCFLGTAIGDALGKPVECETPARIAEKFGRVETTTNIFKMTTKEQQQMIGN